MRELFCLPGCPQTLVTFTEYLEVFRTKYDLINNSRAATRAIHKKEYNMGA